MLTHYIPAYFTKFHKIDPTFINSHLNKLGS